MLIEDAIVRQARPATLNVRSTPGIDGSFRRRDPLQRGGRVQATAAGGQLRSAPASSPSFESRGQVRRRSVRRSARPRRSCDVAAGRRGDDRGPSSATRRCGSVGFRMKTVLCPLDWAWPFAVRATKVAVSVPGRDRPPSAQPGFATVISSRSSSRRNRRLRYGHEGLSRAPMASARPRSPSRRRSACFEEGAGRRARRSWWLSRRSASALAYAVSDPGTGSVSISSCSATGSKRPRVSGRDPRVRGRGTGCCCQDRSRSQARRFAGLSVDELRREIEAQIDVARSAGDPAGVTYVDLNRDLDKLGPVREALRQALPGSAFAGVDGCRTSSAKAARRLRRTGSGPWWQRDLGRSFVTTDRFYMPSSDSRCRNPGTMRLLGRLDGSATGRRVGVDPGTNEDWRDRRSGGRGRCASPRAPRRGQRSRLGRNRLSSGAPRLSRGRAR